MTQNHRNIYGFFILICLGGFIWLSFFNFQNNFTFSKGASICLFKQVSGLPCPSCGTTRSVGHILQGDISNAVKINPLGFIALGSLLLFPAWMLIDFITGKPSLPKTYLQYHEKRNSRWILFFFGFLLLINWIWNIFKGL
jgi:hypothetical protein